MLVGIFAWTDWKWNHPHTNLQQYPSDALSHRLRKVSATPLWLLVRKCCQVARIHFSTILVLWFYYITIDCSADLLMIFLPDESKRTIIPRGIKKLSTSFDSRHPASLYEISLRHLYNDRHIYNTVCRNLREDSLPVNIFNHVQQGPVTICGASSCSTPLFTECHFSLLKK